MPREAVSFWYTWASWDFHVTWPCPPACPAPSTATITIYLSSFTGLQQKNWKDERVSGDLRSTLLRAWAPCWWDLTPCQEDSSSYTCLRLYCPSCFCWNMQGSGALWHRFPMWQAISEVLQNQVSRATPPVLCSPGLWVSLQDTTHGSHERDLKRGLHPDAFWFFVISF